MLARRKMQAWSWQVHHGQVLSEVSQTQRERELRGGERDVGLVQMTSVLGYSCTQCPFY